VFRQPLQRLEKPDTRLCVVYALVRHGALGQTGASAAHKTRWVGYRVIVEIWAKKSRSNPDRNEPGEERTGSTSVPNQHNPTNLRYFCAKDAHSQSISGYVNGICCLTAG